MVSTAGSTRNVSRLSAMQNFRGGAFAYMDTETQWIALNGETDCPPRPWQEEMLRECAKTLSLPPAILATDPISTEKVMRRNKQRATRTVKRSSETKRSGSAGPRIAKSKD